MTSTPQPTDVRDLRAYMQTLPEIQSADRRHSLYADLHQTRQTNLQAYQTNVYIWRRIILHAAEQGWLAGDLVRSSSIPTEAAGFPSAVAASRLTFTAVSLEHLMVYDGDAPLGLLAVVKELEHSGEVMSLPDFRATPAARWSSWFFDKLVSGPLMWGLQQLSIVEEPDPLSQTWGTDGAAPVSKARSLPYVILSLVKRTGEAIVVQQRKECSYVVTDNLMVLSTFRRRFYCCLPGNQKHGGGQKQEIFDADAKADEPLMAEADAGILLQYLERDLRAIVTQRDAKGLVTLIKFIDPEAEEATTISDIDLGIVHVLNFQAALGKQIAALEARLAEMDGLARTALQRKQKSQALAYLRIKKDVTDSYLPARMTALENVSQIVANIQSAGSDAEILRAYRTGAAALRGVLGRHDLQPDKVEKAFDEVQQAFDQYQEVDDAIQLGMQTVTDTAGSMGAAGDTEEDVQLERELAALVGQSELIPELEQLPESEKMDTPHEAAEFSRRKTGEAAATDRVESSDKSATASKASLLAAAPAVPATKPPLSDKETARPNRVPSRGEEEENEKQILAVEKGERAPAE
ncbi:hypothetical protein IWQ60_005906 [Tieghemiomyces parasiticus]|uniref:Uncharacterized protein n=1 Tax=Tieghemiomyces parasiticus TaxID=78921 RepID=A0A9W8DXT9_9FUNG|nr:hypothetical protein IWQ60_005906 [Tieghemiomyces parasiticus]